MPFTNDTYKTKYQRQIENKGMTKSQNYKQKGKQHGSINIRQRAIQGHRQEKRLIGSNSYCILAIQSKQQQKKNLSFLGHKQSNIGNFKSVR